MGVIAFLREWYELRRDKLDYCKSCETYKEQLSLANFEKKQLLERLLHVPETTPQVVQTVSPNPIMPRIVPYRVQKQMLEAEDRAKAATMRRQQEEERLAKANAAKNSDKPIEDNAISVEELEKELGVTDALGSSSS